MDQLWANRAGSAEAAIIQRHLSKLWYLPGTQLGVVAWPSTSKYRNFGTWYYWWQAHLLDCLVDAQVRDPQPDRKVRIERQIRSHRRRNTGITPHRMSQGWRLFTVRLLLDDLPHHLVTRHLFTKALPHLHACSG